MQLLRPVRSLALALLSLSACGGEAGDRAAEKDAAPEERPAWGEGEGWTLAAEPEVVVGGIEERGAALHRVAGAVRLADGRIVVADGGASALRFFDAEGRLLRTAGGPGGGPGEFAWISTLDRFRGDTLLVWDRNAGRISIFAPDGTFVDSHRPQGVDAFPELVGAFADGSYLLSTGFALPRATPRSGTIRQDTFTYVRFDRGGRVLDTIGAFPEAEMIVDVTEIGVAADRVIFGDRSMLATGAERVVVGRSVDYEIAAYTPTGAPAPRVGRRVPLREASQGEVEAYRASLLERDLRGLPPEIRAIVEGRVAAIPNRPTLPILDLLRVDALGFLWVGRFRLPGEPREWDVFSPGGEWLGTLRLPGSLEVFDIGEEYLLGAATDALGVERVELYRLDRG